MSDITEALRERVLAAAVDKQPLRIRGGCTKDFYGNPPVGELLETAEGPGVRTMAAGGGQRRLSPLITSRRGSRFTPEAVSAILGAPVRRGADARAPAACAAEALPWS